MVAGSGRVRFNKSSLTENGQSWAIGVRQVGHGPPLSELARLGVVDVEEADDVDNDLRDDLDLLRKGGLTDIDCVLWTGEDTGDIIGVESGVIVGVNTGDVSVGVKDGDDLGEFNSTREADGTGAEVESSVASLWIL